MTDTIYRAPAPQGPVTLAVQNPSYTAVPGEGVTMFGDTSGGLTIVNASGVSTKLGSGTVGLTLSGSGLTFTTTSTTYGSELLIAGQNAGGTNQQGGGIVLKGGLKSGSGGNGPVSVRNGNDPLLSFNSTGVAFDGTVAAPAIFQPGQGDSPPFDGVTMSITAQSGGVGKNGGNLALASGSKGVGGTDGSVVISAGATQMLAATPSGVSVAKYTGQVVDGTTAAITDGVTVVIAKNDTAPVLLNLPSPAASAYRTIQVYITANASTQNVSLVRAGSEKIDGVAATLVISGATVKGLTVTSDGTDWYTK